MNRLNMQFVVAALFVLLLAAYTLWPSSARSTSGESAPGLLTRRDLQSTEHQRLVVDMMHIHHVDSPYAQPNLTLAERMKIAVKRSQARAEFIRAQIAGNRYSTEQQTTDVLSLPLYHEQSQGEYDINFGLGTPSRTIRATADTGSDLLWVQCVSCSSCLDEPDPLFNPAESSSYEPLSCSTDASLESCPISSGFATCSGDGNCTFTYGYGDGSVDEGNLATEALTLNDVSGSALSFTDIKFGCAHFANGSAVGDGLVGLGLGSFSLVSQLGPKIGHVFSYCLVDFVSARNRTSTLLLGSVGDVPLAYTPMLIQPNQSFYFVNVTDIKVNGDSIDYPADTFAIDEDGYGGLFLDSGTTITQLDVRAYYPLLDSLDSLIPYPIVDESNSSVAESATFLFNYCANVTGMSNATFPTVSFHFQGGVDMVLPTDNLFPEVEENLHCLQIQPSEAGLGSIFGNIQQQNFQIAFDIGQKRIGFAPRTC